MAKESKLLSVTYRDEIVTDILGSPFFTLSHGEVQGVADRLAEDYREHSLGREHSREVKYLINGVYVEVNHVTSAVDFPTEVILRGESETGLAVLAKALDLPEFTRNNLYH
ncbi:MAG: hypothetical protein Q8P57_00320, partial [Candidatus Pacearchaeota archaeon]|nr:hypothetical protein [Candidatus Pacearchaeota archaeon]